MWAHICGSDLVRDGDGLYALEDNLRIPSGVSYMLENRMVAKRVFPELFETSSILPVDEYPSQLYDTLAALSPRPGDTPVIALLTPGVFNSAYFEHAYLAQAMGIELVEGSDLFVADDDCTYMRTVYGPKRVDVVLPPGGRPVHRSGGVPSGFRAGRARPDPQLACRQGRAGQRAGRHGSWPTTRWSSPTCRR